MQAWCALVGISPVNEILVQGTMSGPDGLQNAVDGARDELVSLAATVG